MARQSIATCRHILAVFLLAIIVAVSTVPAPAFAVTSTELRAQANALMNQLDSLQNEINAAQAEYNAADAAQKAAEAAMEEAQSRIDDAKARIAESEKLIAANQEKLKSRAVSIYRNGRMTMLDVLLGSSSFQEFATMTSMVNAVNNRDATLVDQSRAAKAEAEAAKAEAQAAKEEYERQEAEAAAQKQAAADARAQLASKADQMKAEVGRLTAEAAELQAEEEAAAAAAEEAAKAAAAAEKSNFGNTSYYVPSGDVVSGSGQFTHPCPGYRVISSTFGYRSFDNSFHKGTDFAAAQGTPIYAADSGTVVIAGFSSSAGNWVVISHGNGLVTKYMHMAQLPFVSAGQAVSKGQNIGVVGTTGYSTGPHLHFQVEVNGTAVNPMYYL